MGNSQILHFVALRHKIKAQAILCINPLAAISSNAAITMESKSSGFMESERACGGVKNSQKIGFSILI